VASKNNRGFVLIEVLVAVAVAGVILVALSRAFISTWFGISTVREEAEAMLIARTLISAVTPRENASEIVQQGSIGRYNWALEVKRAPMAAPAAAAANETPFPWTLYRVGVVVTAPNGRRTSVETSRLSRP
jgi:prepilin-type N-terminal cleavage/methylation domain-containing protein